MSLNNECTCKRVLVFPRVEEPKKVLIFARTSISSNTSGGNADLSNYYTKQQTDSLLDKKLSTNELDNAIDQALLEAKESGEFKGEKGDKGDKGERGEKGEQGIQGERGADGAQGIQGEKGADGKDGADGYTPQKGVDYFTTKDKQELIAELTPTIESMLNSQIEEVEYGTY